MHPIIFFFPYSIFFFSYLYISPPNRILPFSTPQNFFSKFLQSLFSFHQYSYSNHHSKPNFTSETPLVPNPALKSPYAAKTQISNWHELWPIYWVLTHPNHHINTTTLHHHEKTQPKPLAITPLKSKDSK